MKLLNCFVCGKPVWKIRNRKYCLDCKVKVRREAKRKYDKEHTKTEQYKETQRKYRKSEKGRATCKRLQQSYKPIRDKKQKEYHQKYKKTEAYKIKQKRYRISEKGRLTIKRCAAREDVKQKRKLYLNQPYVKARRKEYHISYSKRYIARPYVKIKRILNLHRREMKIKSLIMDFTEEEWNRKLTQADGFCLGCNEFVGRVKLTIDHIIPVSKAPKGFVYTIKDVQPLCRPCNASKGNKVPAIARV